MYFANSHRNENLLLCKNDFPGSHNLQRILEFGIKHGLKGHLCLTLEQSNRLSTAFFLQYTERSAILALDNIPIFTDREERTTCLELKI